MYYVEWTTSPKNRRGRMITLDALGFLLTLRHNTGYSSIYWFNEEDAKKIKDAGHSGGFDKYEVSAKFLVIDIDSGDLHIDMIKKCLTSRGLAFEVWRSGGKGYHIYIPHKLMTSIHLPHSHKMALKSLIPDAEKYVDMSLYQAGRLLSLPGRIHEKTKNRKEFVESVPGNILEFPILETTKTFREFKSSFDGNMLLLALDRIQQSLLLPPGPGNRHTILWGSARDLLESGLKPDTVLDILQGVNNKWPEPKTDEEVRLAVEQALKTTTR